MTVFTGGRYTHLFSIQMLDPRVLSLEGSKIANVFLELETFIFNLWANLALFNAVTTNNYAASY